MSARAWKLTVGSDVVRDEFFAEIWMDGRQWATVVERDGRYRLHISDSKGFELDCDAALEARAEARRVELRENGTSEPPGE